MSNGLNLPYAGTVSSSDQAAFSVTNTGDPRTTLHPHVVALEGISGKGNGISGSSESATGVRGDSASSYGVWGSTNSPYQGGPGAVAGVWGENRGSGIGVKGTSQGGDGVTGYSSSSAHAGVSAVNDSGSFGLRARGTPAGHFEGDLKVTGKIMGPEWDQMLQRITALEQQVNTLAQKMDSQQPVVESPPLPILTSVGLNIQDQTFVIEGNNFTPNSPVTVRVYNLDGSFRESFPSAGTTDQFGVLAIYSLNIQHTTHERLYFAATDGRPHFQDWTGQLWTDTVRYIP
jgi:hypothetical protein